MQRIFGNGSYANVTATLALIIALGGTSYAAIKLPKNSVTSATVKDRSLLKKDFRSGQLPRGKTGKPGPAGAAGAPGAAGGAGGGGAAVFQRVEAAEAIVVGSAPQVVQSMSLPAGSWVVTAKFVAENGGLDGALACSLDLGGAVVDNLGAGIDFGAGAALNTLAGAATLSGAGAATVTCNTNNTITAGSYRAKSIVAVPVASATAG